MSSLLPDDSREVSAAAMARIDQVCDAFEAAWQANQIPVIEQRLDGFSSHEQTVLLRELLGIELAYRRRHGPAPEPDEYHQRFPQHRVEVANAFRELSPPSSGGGTEEHATQPRHPDAIQPTPGIHVRCPHCHEAMEFIAEKDLTDILCDTCGSKFSLVDDPNRERERYASGNIAHFELVTKLGTGGFGSVWKAYDTKLDRHVAVKVPRAGQLDPIQTEQFLREARAAAQLQHPYIVSVYEVGKEGDSIYIASELIRGNSLAEELSQHRFTHFESAAICAKVAHALHHAHTAGVVHRDLKPSNVMLDAQGEPHLMDFGLAKREAGEITLTLDGQVLGTPAFMSPEQASGQGHQSDGRTDIYSLGVMLYQLLTGELPFRGTMRSVIQQAIHEAAPSPRRFDRSVSADLETICLKCLEKDPRRRYRTALELAADLERSTRGEPILARPISTTQRVLRWCWRNPMPTAVIGLLALLAVAGVGFTYYTNLQNNKLLRIIENSNQTNMLLEREQAANQTPLPGRTTTLDVLQRIAWQHYRSGYDEITSLKPSRTDQAYLDSSLAVLAMRAADRNEALDRLTSAAATLGLIQTSEPDHVAWAHGLAFVDLQAAQLLIRMRQPHTAQPHLSRASRLLGDAGDEEGQPTLLLHRHMKALQVAQSNTQRGEDLLSLRALHRTGNTSATEPIPGPDPGVDLGSLLAELPGLAQAAQARPKNTDACWRLARHHERIFRNAYHEQDFGTAMGSICSAIRWTITARDAPEHARRSDDLIRFFSNLVSTCRAWPEADLSMLNALQRELLWPRNYDEAYVVACLVAEVPAYLRLDTGNGKASPAAEPPND